jgi:hypothetical protein
MSHQRMKKHSTVTWNAPVCWLHRHLPVQKLATLLKDKVTAFRLISIASPKNTYQ